ncbi:MAG: c-type cytochrome [Flavobacteriales bacterium]|nr:c-type cytochrome [Flavobacteriales bacterium]
MRNYLKIFLSVCIMAFFVFQGCNKDEGPFVLTGPIPQDTAQNDTNRISYSKEIQPIFNSNCTTCHSELHAKLNLLPCCSYDQLLNTGFNASYIDTVTPENSRLYKHLTGTLSMMPPSGKISDEQISKIKNWMKEGGRNN